MSTYFIPKERIYDMIPSDNGWVITLSGCDGVVVFPLFACDHEGLYGSEMMVKECHGCYKCCVEELQEEVADAA